MKNMIQSSKLCTVVRSAAKVLAQAFLQSRLYAILLAIVNFFADAYAASKTRVILIGKGDIERFAPDAAFYKGLGGLVGGFIGFFAGICRALRTGAADSVFVKLFHAIFGSYRERYLYFVSFVCVFIFVIPHNFWSNTFGLLFAMLLFALYIVAVSGEKSPVRPGTDFNAVWFSMLLFGVSLLASCFISYDRADSVRVLLFFITSFMLCMILYASLREAKDFGILGGFMYAALILTSLLAFYQRLTGVEADASLTDLTLNRGMPGRVFSTLGNPNNYAEFLVLFMPFAFAYALSHEKGTAKRRALIGGMVLPLGAILLTYSRSGWSALAIAAAIFIMLYDKRLIPVFAILGVCALPFVPSTIWNRILTIGNLQDSSSSYRVDIWTGCLKMLKEYWFTGVGLGTGGFAAIYPRYAVGESGVAPHSHMHFMEMLVELGALGFLSYISLTFCLIRRSFVSSSRKVDAGIRNYAIASAASMTGIVLIGCFEYCWFYPRVMFAFFVCAGIAMAAHRDAKLSERKA